MKYPLENVSQHLDALLFFQSRDLPALKINCFQVLFTEKVLYLSLTLKIDNARVTRLRSEHSVHVNIAAVS